MTRRWVVAAATITLMLAVADPAGASERVQDPAGDAIGDAPDVVAVTFSEPEGTQHVSLSVEFADVPPLDTDHATYTDVVFIYLDVDPETAQSVQLETEDDVVDYIIGAHAVQLPLFLGSGGMIYEAATGDVREHVVDVAVDEATVTWTLDRTLIGDPDAISWAVLAAVEREDREEMAFDVSPDEGEPWGVYEMSAGVATTES